MVSSRRVLVSRAYASLGKLLKEMLVDTHLGAQDAYRVVADVARERVKIVARWKLPSYPSVPSNLPSFIAPPDFPTPASWGMWDCEELGIPFEATAKAKLELRRYDKKLTWADIALEEFSEAVCAPDDKARRAELVQVAAIVLAWIEDIDRRPE